jgi:hypothetical protein
VIGKEGRKVNMVKKCVHIYVNVKMIPFEAIPGIKSGEGRINKWVEGVNSCMIYLIHGNNLCKCHNTLPPSTKIKGKKKIN